MQLHVRRLLAISIVLVTFSSSFAAAPSTGPNGTFASAPRPAIARKQTPIMAVPAPGRQADKPVLRYRVVRPAEQAKVIPIPTRWDQKPMLIPTKWDVRVVPCR